jgi:hypothetical protein
MHRVILQLEGLRSTETSNDFIGNRTRDILACSTVPQTVTLPHAPSEGYSVSETESASIVKGRLHLLSWDC